jgi:hypothetical protein
MRNATEYLYGILEVENNQRSLKLKPYIRHWTAIRNNKTHRIHRKGNT